ncbi:MAG: DUF1553 domain-containing protein [Planctomycetes bacterium]|nr:DUF1553 domain-containing protein [Planctomycetota bacterium]
MRWLAVAMLLLVIGPRGWAADDAGPEVDGVKFFESQVRPILEANCFKCHGNETKIRANLYLTSHAGVMRGSEVGPVVDLQNPADSLLLKMINYTDDDHQMPPSGKLPQEKIDVLTKWVMMGVPWTAESDPVLPPLTPKSDSIITEKARQWWAYQPVARPVTPKVHDATWPRNPIDNFILAKLEAKGLKPAPPADRVTLIRRVYYDLIGLPPTPAQVDAFVHDANPDAYANLIERLLAMPQYGEKWGRHWLDVVRYAETNGYERDNPKPNVFKYRDYVIRAFNTDKPYDQFLREQIAGDELDHVTSDSIIATGYYRLGLWDDEPADRPQAFFDGLDDIVSTTCQSMLAMTVNCARCHNHKVDPIPQADYYRMTAFFRNLTPMANGGPTIERDIFSDDADAAETERLAAQRAERIDALTAQLAAVENELREAYQKFRKTDQPVRLADIESLHYRFYRDTWDKLPDFDQLKPESEGELTQGFYTLNPRTRDDAFGFVFEGMLKVPAAGEYAFEVNADDGVRIIVNGQRVAEMDGVHGFLPEPSRGTITLKAGQVPIRLEYFQKANGLGLEVAWSGPGVNRRLLSETDQPENAGDLRIDRLMAQYGKKLLSAQTVANYRSLRKELNELNKEPVHTEKALCVTENGPTSPDSFILSRGSAHAPMQQVQPGFPQVLGFADPTIPDPAPGAKTTGRRRVLADWIASPKNPLTARVMANRIWQHHFGRGIVRSTNDFGGLGELPTHPQLLDYLATEFIARGWSVKDMHRLILMSSAYQMSSQDDDKALAADPNNDLFWRFDMRRLTAEEIRDSILAINGTLNLQMGGPSIFTKVPAEVLATASRPDHAWGNSPPDQQRRRSVYIHVKRSLVEPILETFDLPDTDTSCAVRFATTVPTQALTGLNSDFMNEQAVIFADRLRAEAPGDVPAQVRRALRLAAAKEPSDAQVQRGVNLIRSLTDKDHLDADKSLNLFCLMVLNMNEFVYLD